MSRSKNVAKNVLIGYFVQVIIFVLTFVTRKIFVNYLSIEYLGINGLFSNLLTILSLAELGLGNIAVFYLYKHVADKNEEEITCYVHFFKKVFYFIFIVVLMIGLLIIPFLKYIVNTTLEISSLYIYYVIFLVGTLTSYLSAHNIALLNAYQDARSYKIITMIVTIIQNILQIVSLIIFKNYIIFILIQMLSILVISLLTNLYTSKKYSFINNKSKIKIMHNKKCFFSDFIAIIIYKFGAIAINNTDNILISILVSTVAVGIYSNYYMIVNAIQTFISIISSSLIISVGNLLTENNHSKNLKMFNNILYLYHFIATACSICLYFCLNTFVLNWVGNDYLFENIVIISICLNFYFNTAISPVWMFRESAGLFKKVKYIMVVTAVLNIALSIIFGKLWGVFGILIATVISKILSIFWYEPRILFKKCFAVSSKIYWKKQFKYFCCAVISFVLCYCIDAFIDSGLIFIIVKCLLYLSVCLIVFALLNCKSDELAYIKLIIKRVIKRKQVR